MAGTERRSHDRIRVRFPCELQLSRRSGSGTVRDLSAGGLCVQTHLQAQEGDELRVRLHPKGRASLDIQALVWTVAGVRDRRSGERSLRLGLVLSDATQAFLDLLGSRTQAAPASRPTASRARPSTAPKPPRKPAARPAPERAYRVRVRQAAGSRTCTLMVFASSGEAAEATALAEAGEGWSVLGIKRQEG